MVERDVKIISEQVERDFLPFVRKPGRYIGGEVNQVKKDLAGCELRLALCFPDVYEIAMSHTGLVLLYDRLNKVDNIAAERIYSPWVDGEEVVRKNGVGLFSLESKATAKSFDVIGFSLSNELCYTNVLNMLDLAGLELRSANRGEDDPIIIAGGVMANCCEPIADFIDLFILGEAEQAIVDFAKLVIEQKKAEASKKEILEAAAERFEWVYVPILYKDGQRFENAVAGDFETALSPAEPIVPFVQAVQERVSVEVMRGCPGRCRFCQASFCRRPIRYKEVSKIVESAKAAYKATGFDTVSLLSLSTADYPELEELLSQLDEYFTPRRVGVSVPSLRVDQQLKILPKLVKSVRKSGLTIAVEAASFRLRQVINKPLKDEDLFAAVEEAYIAGWQKFKLYFMVGLPGEREEDIREIVQLCFKLAKLRKKVDGKTGNINVAISWFVPKCHTPFAWLGQNSENYFKRAKQIILDEKRNFRAKFLNFKFHNIEQSVLEAATGRGDRKLGDVIETAWRDGARFDLWSEGFDYSIWQKAFAEHGLDINECAERKFEAGEVLPWEHLGGPGKDYLWGHLMKANELLATENTEIKENPGQIGRS